MVNCISSILGELNLSSLEYSIGKREIRDLGITDVELQEILDIPATESEGQRIHQLEKLIMKKVFERYINLSSINVDAESAITSEFITDSIIRDQPEMMNRVVEFGLRGFNDQMLRYQFPIVWDMDYMATLLPEIYSNDH